MKNWAFTCASQSPLFESQTLSGSTSAAKVESEFYFVEFLLPEPPQRVNHFIDSCKPRVSFDNTNTYPTFNTVRNSNTVIVSNNSACFYYAAGF